MDSLYTVAGAEWGDGCVDDRAGRGCGWGAEEEI